MSRRRREPPESALRWPDSRLSFRIDVEKWAAKAKSVAYHLRVLTNTKHGPLPSAVRSAVRVSVEPVLLYGSEAWYPGMIRPRWSQPTRDPPSSNQHLIQRRNKALNQSMRPILPLWETTPTAAPPGKWDTASYSGPRSAATQVLRTTQVA
ncbi:endonuclease reverse transcriptase [Fusarium mundagurra]|uniref:Endonuclease reverse transcriptase n=1 Tax=Fusarium mundagurra TaxID=1567541 RepID=A0A8H6CYK0_9HYPO|nr:endonuclease reverse transcriptase [Fusarium mundagurra]